MTYRIKPLVWACVGNANEYTSIQGGFTVTCSVGGWKWQRGHVVGFADSRQGALDAANERHAYEVSALLEPTNPLAAALALPEIKALVDAVNVTTIIAHALDDGYIDEKVESQFRSALGEINAAIVPVYAALAALTKEGE
jgi:hypothetical protein